MRIEPSKCAVCGDCVDMCPLGIIEKQGMKMVVKEGCIECGDCVDVCPVDAIELENE